MQVGVPARATEVFLPRLELALEAMVREAVGWEAPVQVSVEPVEASVGDVGGA